MPKTEWPLAHLASFYKPLEGAVGASANGPGILDATGGSLGDVGDGQSGVGEPDVPETVDWGTGWPDVWKTEVEYRYPEDWVEEVAEVAIDWGSVLSGAIDIAQGQYPAAVAYPAPQQFVGAAPTMPVVSGVPPMIPPTGGALCGPNGGCGPRFLTYDCKTGQLSARRRRRRGKLLTAGRKEDLAFVIAMYGKGAASQIALAKAMS